MKTAKMSLFLMILGLASCSSRPDRNIDPSDDMLAEVDAMQKRAAAESLAATQRLPPISEAQFDSFQSMASKACQCQMRTGKSAAESCWHDFYAATQKFSGGEEGSASAPASTKLEIFNVEGREHSVVKMFLVNALDNQEIVCTGAQRDELDTIFAKGTSDPSTRRKLQAAIAKMKAKLAN